MILGAWLLVGFLYWLTTTPTLFKEERNHRRAVREYKEMQEREKIVERVVDELRRGPVRF